MGASPHAIHQVQDFKRGSSFSANQLNAVLAAVQGQANIGAGFQQMEIEEWLGIIDASDQTEYTDERYWVKNAYCNTDSGDNTANITFAAKDTPWGNEAFQTTATNLDEILAHSHLLAPQTPVHVFGVFDAQWPAIKHYYFCGGVITVFPVTLSVTSGYDTATGDTASQCGYVYDVSDLSGNSLGNSIDPTHNTGGDGGYWQRPSRGYCISANFGLAFYNSSGDLLLTWINEVPDAEACS